MEKPDWASWRDMNHVELWQFTALSLDASPADVKTIYNGRFDKSIDEPFCKEFERRLKILANNTPMSLHPMARINKSLVYSQPIFFRIGTKLAVENYDWSFPDEFRSMAELADKDKRPETPSANSMELMPQLAPVSESETTTAPFTAQNIAAGSPAESRPELDGAPAVAAESVKLAQSVEELGLSKREKQIRVIVTTAETKGYKVLSIETGNKALLRKACKTSRPDLFGAGDNPFDDAWEVATRSDPPRLRMADHDKFARR
ncbi:hypothetical protein [Glaciimonas immobilis]|uniref:Uncharacterized protein n=1 Tax=Glaciimonas immobilis TaxID=728004 RepID=A0A840RPT6_9BURK|nr:hypothetical protein [Glaciimonas immobilis]KAF3999179.1 hypothetical protein HAV38_04375 [Glaciimonas immobilis]MBB5198631.1 hypothetical protein [Glaciimonas immobilis]